MTSTLAYRGYRRDQFDQREVSKEEGSDTDSFTSSSISSFYLPVSIKVELRPAGSLTFVFAYPNDEPAESHRRSHPKGGQVSFLLAKNTLKILEVRFLDGKRRLEEGHAFSFPLDAVAAWGSGLDDYKRHSFQANVKAVRDIMASVPPIFRQKALAEFQAGPPWERGEESLTSDQE